MTQEARCVLIGLYSSYIPVVKCIQTDLIIHCCVVLCCFVLCCFVLCCVVLCCVVLCCVVLFCVVLCCIVIVLHCNCIVIMTAEISYYLCSSSFF